MIVHWHRTLVFAYERGLAFGRHWFRTGVVKGQDTRGLGTRRGLF